MKNLLILVLIFILLEISYSKFVKKEKPVNLLGFSFLIVTTGSMEPEINAGELIMIKKSNEYKIGDIITFIDQDNFLITHRIIESNENLIITKGDNNDLEDEPILFNNIKGKVIFHSKILGIFIFYLLKPLIFIYIIYVLIINSIKKFFIKEREKIEYENKQSEDESKENKEDTDKQNKDNSNN